MTRRRDDPVKPALTPRPATGRLPAAANVPAVPTVPPPCTEPPEPWDGTGWYVSSLELRQGLSVVDLDDPELQRLFR